jgi:predicted amidohydrolase YtcJ
MRRAGAVPIVCAAVLLGCVAAGPLDRLPGPRKPKLPHTVSARTPADLVILNASIYTAARPARAQAMAVRGGRIVAVGSNRDVTPYLGSQTEIWDIPGRAVLPGLIDSHGHMKSLGDQLATVDLVGTKSYPQVIERVTQRARRIPAGDWVLGRGWDQNDWPVEAMPTHQPLSAAVPDHPVSLERIDGHALLVNRMALDRAGITARTPDPPGGLIERDARGEPTGVLLDNAASLIENRIADPGPEERERRLLEAMRACARAGLTMVHDAGIGRATLAAYRDLLSKNEFPIRIYAMASAGDSLAEDLFRRGCEVGDRLTVRAIKVVDDGALGSRGALLSAPYSDRPGHVGLERWSVDSLARLCVRARESGLQMRVHAIGDLANTHTLDAFEKALAGEPHPELRWAIEHCQVVRPADVERFARDGIVASMQPTHATSDGPWAEERLGPTRIRWAYAWRRFLRAGVPIASGSDFPVESERPLLGLYAAITRRDLDGKLPRAGWRPEERMSKDEALRSFTYWGAWLAFQEGDLGSLEVNKLADFVVVDPDPLEGGPEMLTKSLVMKTVVGGKVVWDAKKP